IWEILPEAIKHCCFNEDGVAFYEFNQRDLFYAVRRLALERGAAEPKFSYFTTILTDYENEVGEIELITRDARGVFSAPGGELLRWAQRASQRTSVRRGSIPTSCLSRRKNSSPC